jgi:4'-phosphopantetheinyl transferase EntD
MAESALTSRDELFPLAFRFADARFGTCVGVHLPAGSVDPLALLESLHAEERELCRAMRGARLTEFAGGRVASRLARAGMEHDGSPTLFGANGAPHAGSVRISLSHTQRLAVALASPDVGYAVGVDVEAIAGDRRGDELLAERILSPEEGADIDIVQRLSIKEAAYKALFALTHTHLPLRDIVVARVGDGFRIRVPTAEVEAFSSRIEGHYLSLARGRPTA